MRGVRSRYHSSEMAVVGVISIQGDFEAHLKMLDSIGADARPVRTPQDLDAVDRAIIPGGESSTVGMLMERFGLGAALQTRAAEGMPIWGTCMGMILLARDVEPRKAFTLGLLDITVQRNAFGAQVHSFEAPVPVAGLDEPVMGVFIRAPVVTRVGDGVEVLSEYEGRVVGVRSGNLVGTSYHPELTSDSRLHEWFCAL